MPERAERGGAGQVCRVGRVMGLAVMLLMLSGCAPAPRLPPSATATPSPASMTFPTALPSPSSSPTAAPSVTPTVADPSCGGKTGLVEATSYISPGLGEPVAVLVYLPPCYPDQSGGFPALYLLHGKPFRETHWEDLGVVEAAEDGLQSGAWPSMILIMPLQPEPLFSSSDGGPGSYEAEMMEGLIPFIQENYRVGQGAGQRALAGISRGGIWALEISFRHPDAFGQVAAFSPSLAVNYPRQAYDPLFLAEQAPDLPPRIFLLAGQEDWALRHTLQLADLLLEAGHQPSVSIVEGGHVAATWQAGLHELLTFIAAGWEPGD
jgi:enterochelin esterase-like enzyme